MTLPASFTTMCRQSSASGTSSPDPNKDPESGPEKASATVRYSVPQLGARAMTLERSMYPPSRRGLLALTAGAAVVTEWRSPPLRPLQVAYRPALARCVPGAWHCARGRRRPMTRPAPEQTNGSSKPPLQQPSDLSARSSRPALRAVRRRFRHPTSSRRPRGASRSHRRVPSGRRD